MATEGIRRAPRVKMSGGDRKVVAATMVGTTIEWYDFFIYAQAAGLIFAQLYFSPLGSTGAQLASWASLGISFLFRPLGAVVAGHLGDRVGRKAMLVLTLLMMGGATALIGVLPTYAAIGIWAPILLVLLRILQGFSAGGEWGGAALMSVEHAPLGRRGLFGAYPQIGVPVGLILASLVIFILRASLGTEAFLAWGWRVPFLLSVVLIVVGYLIRRAVAESPVFVEMAQRKRESSAPLGVLMRSHKRSVILTAVIFIGNNAAGYMVIAFFSSYATKTLKMDTAQVLLAILLASVGWLIFTLYGGALSDRIGRVRTFQIGYAWIFVWMIPMFLLIDTRNIWIFGLAIFVLTIGLGLSYGPMSAMYAEMFPANVRYSGVSIGYALGAILGGAFAPLIADALMTHFKWSPAVGIYIMALCAISFIGASMVKETRGVPLGVGNGKLH
ncbi:MHS family MFS transporter [Paeniglutamicibacter antarcticus]|uniref:MHS family MFS transporter n=1 Tax=Arthrobacter terrae TaxID=2935737 RepID=A0A931CU70_9MICC|nr:MFS transporter [Arthrobacter terrae]MBG0741484.1 MHS family MFS transporter [Arthrobacter terrae]